MNNFLKIVDKKVGEIIETSKKMCQEEGCFFTFYSNGSEVAVSYAGRANELTDALISSMESNREVALLVGFAMQEFLKMKESEAPVQVNKEVKQSKSITS